MNSHSAQVYRLEVPATSLKLPGEGFVRCLFDFKC